MKIKKRKKIWIAGSALAAGCAAGAAGIWLYQNRESGPEMPRLPEGMELSENVITASGLTATGMSEESWELGFLEDGLYVDIPLTPVEPLSLEINAEGTSFGTTHNVKGGASLTLASISLSPLSLHMEYSYPAGGGEAEPLLLFRKTDGTLLSWGQVVGTSGGMFATGEEDSGTAFISADYRLRSVLDLSRLDAVVFNGMAYPLDGGRPEKVEVDPALYPFQIPLMESLGDGGGHGVPVRALCEGLGVECIWDNEAQTATMTYRGVTIVLTPGSTTALVNGQPVEMYDAPAVQDGKLAAECQVFMDAWQLDMSAAYEDGNAEDAQRVAWLVIP